MRPNEPTTIVGLVESIDFQQYRRQPLLEAMISDETAPAGSSGSTAAI